ncbi:unnamed protein product [Protopolystoma xenopodis]|uniref:Uncharacterized protein n=1 Tax=Protopolystoma xenopodis TaxID=117903 RepID=A0A448XL84_9PLAT|nr:unnamed protein product [Protopolystoma xenopodis]
MSIPLAVSKSVCSKLKSSANFGSEQHLILEQTSEIRRPGHSGHVHTCHLFGPATSAGFDRIPTFLDHI